MALSKSKFKIPLIVFLSIITLLALSALIIILIFPSLTSPQVEVPKVNPELNQALMQNSMTKIRVSMLDMVKSGRGSIELTGNELNALIFPVISRALPEDLEPLGSVTYIYRDRSIITHFAFEWQKRTMGLKLVYSLKASPRGELVAQIQQVKLGKLSIPNKYITGYLQRELQNVLPRGPIVNQDTNIIFSPSQPLSQLVPPIIKDPKLLIPGIDYTDGRLRVNMLLSFRLFF